MNRKAAIPLLVIVIAGAVGFTVHAINSSFKHPSEKVTYPYVCKGCGAVFDVSALRKDGMWRVPPKAPSDSVVFCIKCDKGWAYPVNKCGKCGAEYILHLTRDARCPRCVPQAADAARKAGVDVLFKRPG